MERKLLAAPISTNVLKYPFGQPCIISGAIKNGFPLHTFCSFLKKYVAHCVRNSYIIEETKKGMRNDEGRYLQRQCNLNVSALTSENPYKSGQDVRDFFYFVSSFMNLNFAKKI